MVQIAHLAHISGFNKTPLIANQNTTSYSRHDNRERIWRAKRENVSTETIKGMFRKHKMSTQYGTKSSDFLLSIFI